VFPPPSLYGQVFGILLSLHNTTLRVRPSDILFKGRTFIISSSTFIGGGTFVRSGTFVRGETFVRSRIIIYPRCIRNFIKNGSGKMAKTRISRSTVKKTERGGMFAHVSARGATGKTSTSTWAARNTNLRSEILVQASKTYTQLVHWIVVRLFEPSGTCPNPFPITPWPPASASHPLRPPKNTPKGRIFEPLISPPQRSAIVKFCVYQELYYST
jgi:hypothetical protein